MEIRVNEVGNWKVEEGELIETFLSFRTKSATSPRSPMPDTNGGQAMGGTGGIVGTRRWCQKVSCDRGWVLEPKFDNIITKRGDRSYL